jgi:hypothetical protein
MRARISDAATPAPLTYFQKGLQMKRRKFLAIAAVAPVALSLPRPELPLVLGVLFNGDGNTIVRFSDGSLRAIETTQAVQLSQTTRSVHAVGTRQNPDHIATLLGFEKGHRLYAGFESDQCPIHWRLVYDSTSSRSQS